MTTRLPARLFACLILALQRTCGATDAAPCGNVQLRELAATYQTYRSQVRHEPDLHTPELSDWNGSMHRVMAQLGGGLAAQHASATCAEALLGAPDEKRSSGQRHGNILVGSGEQHFVYWWRGGHDYLYLVVRSEHVAQAQWWFAGE